MEKEISDKNLEQELSIETVKNEFCKHLIKKLPYIKQGLFVLGIE